MKIVLDTSVLMYLAYPTAPAPPNLTNGEPLQHCQERIEGFLDDLDRSGAQIIIPTPVLSELLIQAGEKQAELLAALANKRSVFVAPFDQVAAVENAALRRSRSLNRKNRGETKKEVSFDLQILAIARAQQADKVGSDDKNIRSRCATAGIKVFGIAELPVPESKRQIDLSLPANDEQAG